MPSTTSRKVEQSRRLQQRAESMIPGGVNSPVRAFRAVGGPLALDALGRHSEADQAMAIAEQKYGIGMAYQIAYLYASRKDLDRAFHWLERAYQQKDGGLADMKTDPMLKNLRQDPRFKALLRKMRLPE